MMDEEEMVLEGNVVRQEYQWLLNEEAQYVLQEVQSILMDASKSFPQYAEHDQENRLKPEKFLLTSGNVVHQVKCMVTVVGNFILEADLALKLQKQQVVPHQTRIYSDNPWRLQQIQDAGNHLLNALCVVNEYKYNNTCFATGRKLINLLDCIIDSVKLSRECLTLPRKRTLEEIVKNPCLKLFKPALPNDAVVSFYIQAQKLVLAVYHLCTNPLNKIDIASRYQLECSIPWLNDTLVLLTTALHKCQELKDKLTVVTLCNNKLQNDYLTTEHELIAAATATTTMTTCHTDTQQVSWL